MIPRLEQFDALPSQVQNYFKELRSRSFKGDMEFSLSERLMMATDNSIYQLLPQGVVFPKNEQDIKTILELANTADYRNLSFTARGGGTGTNGQSLTTGVVVDLSRHMNRILEVNAAEGWVRVQPGVVLDQLNEHIRSYGLFFAPDLSPSNRATLGGMVSTDACGKGSRIYGKTSNHILELKLVLSDGSDWLSQKMDAATLKSITTGNKLIDHALRTVSSITLEKSELIEAKFPKLTRFLSGYNLGMVWDENGHFNLNYLISGAEGTLCLVSEMKLQLTPIPQSKVLIVAKYREFSDSLKAAKALLSRDPVAIETIDATILSLARQDTIWHEVSNFFSSAEDRLVKSINLIEFVGDDYQELRTKAEQLCSDLNTQLGQPGAATGFILTENENEIRALWSLRKKGVGLLGNRSGTRRPIPFVEDTVVPPEHLAEYIERFRAILDSHGLEYGMFGHVDVGCLHVRPALDMQNPEDEKLVRSITDEVKDLVLEYGGVVWGEHGKGLRSEYMPEFFGEELFEDLRTIKTAFDPHNRLNPGKICFPHGAQEGLVKLDQAPMRGQFDRQIKPELQEQFRVSLLCNGNGACFNYDVHDVMCPSYKVTRNRIHSPKGRAGLIREWVRQLSQHHETSSVKAGIGKLSSRQAQGDFSTEVLASMTGCLSCKACSSSCPIKVDIPDQKARFLEYYYSRYKRPRWDRLIAFGEHTHRRFVNMPFLFNWVLNIPGVQQLMARYLGLVDTPALSSPNYLALLRKADIPVLTSFKHLPEKLAAKSLIVLPDAITCFYEAETFVEVVKFFKNVGYEPIVAPFFINGKGLHVKGFLKEFRQVVQATEEKLEQLKRYQVPLIGVDPAITLTYREEYRRYGRSGQEWDVMLPQEWLVKNIENIAVPTNINAYLPKILYQLGHCGEKSSRPQYAREWQQVFARFQIELREEKVGCCGMAGAFGHEAQHYNQSHAIFDQSWALKMHPEHTYIATGASCRSQVKRFMGMKIAHPLAWLNRTWM